MDSESVSQLVLEQIGDDWGKTNLHGVDLRKSLVSPEQILALNATDESEASVWLVMLAHPDTRLGFAVGYEEELERFALIQLTKDYQPCIVGRYKGFFEALEAM